MRHSKHCFSYNKRYPRTPNRRLTNHCPSHSRPRSCQVR
jgi:hypothetical protein